MKKGFPPKPSSKNFNIFSLKFLKFPKKLFSKKFLWRSLRQSLNIPRSPQNSPGFPRKKAGAVFRRRRAMNFYFLNSLFT